MTHPLWRTQPKFCKRWDYKWRLFECFEGCGVHVPFGLYKKKKVYLSLKHTAWNSFLCVALNTSLLIFTHLHSPKMGKLNKERKTQQMLYPPPSHQLWSLVVICYHLHILWCEKVFFPFLIFFSSFKNTFVMLSCFRASSFNLR